MAFYQLVPIEPAKFLIAQIWANLLSPHSSASLEKIRNRKIPSFFSAAS
ncbi:hypothetical protein PEDI_24540 [Persicobacter diffluens]|uniref:Uncharacterized protein n=1 Tax=Persicobacter diffluens TaxID=981 RepID=A0AAN5AKK3_9BACT|nr:hypothetical protein PEDI_24540 [Persicobacter diffluens]